VKTAGILLLACLHGAPLWAQSAMAARSVWTEDYTAEALEAAVASGKTTLVYSGGSSLAVANHVQVARYVARRVAEELANALVLPITSDGPASPRARPPAEGGAPGNAYETVSRALQANAFEDVVIIADEGAGSGDRALENLAKRLDAAEKPSGIHVYYVTAHELRPGQGLTFNADYLRRWAGRTVPAEHRKRVEDEAELLFVDPQRKWLSPDMIPVEDRAVVVPALGRILLEQRVSSILNQIRALSPKHLR
jgi:creatinine amidohydrolase